MSFGIPAIGVILGGCARRSGSQSQEGGRFELVHRQVPDF